MKHLWPILGILWSGQSRAMLRGTVLAIAVLAAGVALLGLSGWFITAASAAGLAGIGIAFNVFQPSAAVRMLALGRTAARYGERLLTHDAALRALAALRGQLLGNVLQLPHRRLIHLRGSEVLNRLVADVEALDGIALRLVIPAISGAIVIAATLGLLVWLTTPLLAAWVVGSFVLGGAAAYAHISARALAPSRRAEKALQALRLRVIDSLHSGDDLAVQGKLATQKEHIAAAESRLRSNQRQLNQVERSTAFVLSVTAVLAAGGALWLGGSFAAAGVLPPPQAALAFFIALALFETVAPLQRGLSEFGRMVDAARRVNRLLDSDPEPPAGPGQMLQTAKGPALALQSVSYGFSAGAPACLKAVSLVVAQGETVALVGPSGSGKSTLLNLCAGLVRPDSGAVRIFGMSCDTIADPELRRTLAYLPQRSTLLGRSLFETLALAQPEVSRDRAQQVVEQLCLSDLVEGRGGLSAPLRDNGAGLSGGERRRLAIARVVLRDPRILLLDEPTEGLDQATAQEVLAGIRRLLPDCAILLASHRGVEQSWADRTVAITKT